MVNMNVNECSSDDDLEDYFMSLEVMSDYFCCLIYLNFRAFLISLLLAFLECAFIDQCSASAGGNMHC